MRLVSPVKTLPRERLACIFGVDLDRPSLDYNQWFASGRKLYMMSLIE